MLQFVPANLTQWKSILINLNTEYLAWIFQELKNRYNVELDLMPLDENFDENVKNYVESALTDLIPSTDSPIIKKNFYLVFDDEQVIGMGGVRELTPEIGEIKRMYVLPAHRRKGYGKQILHYLVQKGKDLGFSKIRLDTGKFMTAAQHIYRSAGFYETEIHLESEVPMDGRPYWLFMEKCLE